MEDADGNPLPAFPARRRTNGMFFHQDSNVVPHNKHLTMIIMMMERRGWGCGTKLGGTIPTGQPPLGRSCSPSPVYWRIS
eukprot:g9769.t1